MACVPLLFSVLHYISLFLVYWKHCAHLSRWPGFTCAKTRMVFNCYSM